MTVYILRLRSGGLYVGVTTDIDRRMKEHFSGCGCRTTMFDPPVQLVYQESFASLEDAERREHQIKLWKRAKKEALIAGDLGTLHALAIRRKY